MTDIQELMQRNPLHLTKHPEEVDEIIAALRTQRNNFNLGNKKAGSAKPKSEKTKTALKFADKLDTGGIEI